MGYKGVSFNLLNLYKFKLEIFKVAKYKTTTIFLFSLSIILLASCLPKASLTNKFECSIAIFSNLEKINDFKNFFTVYYPDKWKTNLYYDKNQSSIFTADTTKQLTETMLLDITHVSNKLTLDFDFISKIKKNLHTDDLVETESSSLNFKDQKAYYFKAAGKKGKFDYNIFNLFIKINENNYIHSKIEVYGDSLINQRICNGIRLINKITY